MKTRIFFGIVFIGMTTIFQGCYTILDIPEGNNDGYVTTYQYVPYFPDGTIIETPPPTYSLPSNGYDQTVKGTNPPTKERTNGTSNGNNNIRNDGNGRGDTGRDTEFTRTSSSNTGTTQSSTSNTTSNSNTRSSSNTGNSGNGRR
jgi:hypothetical protein